MEYEDASIQIAKQLFRSFMQLRKADWHERPIAGCKSSEFKILLCLKHTADPDVQGLMISELSQILQVTSPTVTQQVKLLEERGLIKRTVDSKDRRAVRLRISDKGVAVLKEAYHSMIAFFQGLVQHLGEENSKQLAELLEKSAHYIEETVQKKE